MRLRRHRLFLAALTILMLALGGWLATTQAGGRALLALLEWHVGRADSTDVRANAQVIVVLGGRTKRVHEGARLALATGLPIALVGKGSGDSGFAAESEKMEDILLRQYGIGPRWVETESRDTRENALFAHCLLSSFGVRRIALVTNAFHMRRASRRFEAAGFQVIRDAIPDADPAQQEALTVASFFPTKAGIAAARLPIREWGGVLLAPIEDLLDPPRACPYDGTGPRR